MLYNKTYLSSSTTSWLCSLCFSFVFVQDCFSYMLIGKRGKNPTISFSKTLLSRSNTPSCMVPFLWSLSFSSASLRVLLFPSSSLSLLRRSTMMLNCWLSSQLTSVLIHQLHHSFYPLLSFTCWLQLAVPWLISEVALHPLKHLFFCCISILVLLSLSLASCTMLYYYVSLRCRTIHMGKQHMVMCRIKWGGKIPLYWSCYILVDLANFCLSSSTLFGK